jgi:glucosamine kinase
LLEKIYHQRQPVLFLSRLAEFFVDNHADPFLQGIIINGFELMIKTYLLPLKVQQPDAEIHFAGSVAAGFKPYLQQAANNTGVQIAYILKEPINNLLTYYSNKN